MFKIPNLLTINRFSTMQKYKLLILKAFSDFIQLNKINTSFMNTFALPTRHTAAKYLHFLPRIARIIRKSFG